MKFFRLITKVKLLALLKCVLGYKQNPCFESLQSFCKALKVFGLQTKNDEESLLSTLLDNPIIKDPIFRPINIFTYGHIDMCSDIYHDLYCNSVSLVILLSCFHAYSILLSLLGPLV